jgi:peptide-methionine (S)-S-oxide reductase
MSIIFYHNEEQKDTALESMQRKADSLGKTIVTEVIPFSKFYLAEGYHQKYYLQGEKGLFKEFVNIYSEMDQIINSRAAAKVNSYISGYGELETLKAQIDSFGLTESGKERLMQLGQRLTPISN